MKTSLEKSHSKVSNAKLTLICFLLSIFVSCVWLGIILLIAFNDKVNTGISISIIAGSAVLSLISFYLISRFTR